MSAKDWMLLLTPIIANGVLIFLFQQFVQGKINKSIRVEERKKVIVEQYLSMLERCIEIVSEVDTKFRFREDMEDINEEFKMSVSELCRYGANMDSVLNMADSLEQLRARCGYCHNQLIRYQKQGELDFPMDEQERIIEDLRSIKDSLREFHYTAIKK